MKVGVLGSGEVGQTLGSGFIKHGHQVMLGTRDPKKLDEWKKSAGKDGQVGSFADAAAYGEIVVVATKGSAAQSSLDMAGAKIWMEKIVIDATNPITDAPPENGVLKFTTSLEQSGMERLQTAFPKARFVKAFSCIGADFMVNPKFKEGKPTMFICGDDAQAKKYVTGILTAFGFDTEDMGGAASARAIEPLCMLWCLPGFLRNEWSHAFKLLKK